MYSYNIPKGKEADYAYARAEDVNASFKDLAEVCGNIRSRDASWAVELLEKAEKGEIPLRFRRRNKYMGHRRELGGRKGRWPKKCARVVLKVLKSAIANAQAKGLSEELVVEHVCANKKNSYLRMAPKGRRSWHSLETARVEIVLKEKEGAKRPPKKEKPAPKEGKAAAKPEAGKKAEAAAPAEKPKEAAKPEVKAAASEAEAKPESPKKAEKPAEKKVPGKATGERPAEAEKKEGKPPAQEKAEEAKMDPTRGKAQKLPREEPGPKEKPKRRDEPKKRSW